MGIVSFDKDTIIDYVPKYGGNRQNIDPCVVRLKYVPYSRVQHYSRIIASKTRGMSDSLRATEVTHEVQKKQFVDSVESVSNYFIGNREVVDGAEFYETADTDLIIEIIQAMESLSKLDEGQRKN